ncbi:cell number regulator 10 [Amborella trichopoda]|uniref:Uncharacterized protein n=1 Tax=Amborella trichopoda TaxID=13333 RepID=W1NFT2_AMBTC|nr:cell number regulator 10 [Amborella trichopoda]ERM94040.1 hypothetical protein AMTR_s00010p00033430 [Amborella trichopoda]|eukprot:XP_020519878.1 cell number regulator 10 [Amborella trichopoda]
MYPNGDQNKGNVPPQFTPMQTLPQNFSPWSTGLCGCCEDPTNCFTTCCCPCITFGRIAEVVDRGTTSCAVSSSLFCCLLWFTCCPYLYSCTYRSKLRGQFNLEESPCADCLVHWACGYCALCQEYRELKNRGLDPSFGWQANADRMNRGVVTPPAIENGMSR